MSMILTCKLKSNNEFTNMVNIDFEKIQLLERKFTRELINAGKIMSFKDIKKLDRIEIGDGKSDKIVLSDNIPFSSLNFSFYMCIPFINTGVMVFYVLEQILYFHFTVKNVDIEKREISMDIDMYEYSEGYYSKVANFECVYRNPTENYKGLSFQLNDIMYNFAYYEYIKNTLNLSKSELDTYEIWKNIFINKKQSQIKDESDMSLYTVTSNIINTFIYINNCIDTEKNNKATKLVDIADMECNRSSTALNTVIINKPKSKYKTDVVVINGIKIKRGENSQIKIRQGTIINRLTQVWGVIGHVRHYKNGKTVYIHPYKKGPGRLKSEEPSRKIYKVKTDQEVI